MEWPARSPDCNPIENLWHDIKNEADRKVKEHTSLQDLRRILQLAWVNLDQQRKRTLVNSMRKMCHDVIEKDGGPAHYSLSIEQLASLLN